MNVNEIKVNPFGFIGQWLALIMSYKMWGWQGCLFTVGLLMSGGHLLSATFTLRKRVPLS